MPTKNENRIAKYKNTKCFTYTNPNPLCNVTADCVFRAFSIAFEKDWELMATLLSAYTIPIGGTATSKEFYEKFLDELGIKKQKQPRLANGKKLTGEAFCKAHPTGIYLAHIGGHHIVCIRDGAIHDTWNSSRKCIGNYWIISETDVLGDVLKDRFRKFKDDLLTETIKRIEKLQWQL